MTEFETSYVPGRWVSAAGSASWLLADIDPSDPTVLSCWALLRDGAAIDAVLDVLLSRGLRSVPGFALVRLTDAGGATVVVRGSASVVARGGPIDQEIDGADAASWREAAIAPGFTQLRLQASEDSSSATEDFAALSPGLALATTIRIAVPAPEQPAPAVPDESAAAPAAEELPSAPNGWASGDAADRSAAAVAEPSFGYIASGGPAAIGLSAAMPAAASLAPPVDVEQDGEREGTQPSGDVVAEPVGEALTEQAGEPDTDELAKRGGAEPEAETVAEPEAETVAEPQAETVAEPQAETVAEPEAETVAEPEAETVAEPPAEVAADQAGEPGAQEPSQLATEQLPPEAAAGLAESTEVGEPPEPVQDADDMPELADLDELAPADQAAVQHEDHAEWAAPAGLLPPTEAIASEEFLESVDGAGDDGAPQAQDAAAAPLVDAVRCERGHYNPLTVGVCRVCGIPLQSQVPVRIPRPQLGVLRLSTGDVVPLDRDVVLGRNPTPEAAGIPEDAHVVPLASPNHDMSRTHAAIHLDGWIVLLADLNSTNGTVVSHPWHEPMRLRPNEPVAIEPGTVVNLANEVTFRYEPAG
jgi:FHA domain